MPILGLSSTDACGLSGQTGAGPFAACRSGIPFAVQHETHMGSFLVTTAPSERERALELIVRIPHQSLPQLDIWAGLFRRGGMGSAELAFIV